MCAELLPALPPGGASSGTGGHLAQPCRVSLRGARKVAVIAKDLRAELEIALAFPFSSAERQAVAAGTLAQKRAIASSVASGCSN